MTEEDARARDAADPLSAMRDRFCDPDRAGRLAGDLPGRSVAGPATPDRGRGHRDRARRVGAPRGGRLVRPGPPVVHPRCLAARVDGPDRRRSTHRSGRAQQPDRRHPPPARLVLPARRPQAADPGRWAAVPVGSARPDQPSRLAWPRSRDRPRRRRSARRRAPRPDRGHRGRHRGSGSGPRAGLPLRCQLRDRSGTGDRTAHRRGPVDRRGRRLGPGPCRGQHRARSPRLGRGLRRLVHLQVPERRSGVGRGDLRPRAPRPGSDAPAAGWLVGPRPGRPVRPGRAVRPGRGRRRLGDLDDVDPCPRTGRRVAGDLRRGRHARAARTVGRAHRLSRGVPGGRAHRDHHATRPGRPRRPALAPPRRCRGPPRPPCRTRSRRRLPRPRPHPGRADRRSTRPTTSSDASPRSSPRSS